MILPTPENPKLGEILARIYADPYGWLERGAERISFVTLTDNMAVIHFDDQPALSALGTSPAHLAQNL